MTRKLFTTILPSMIAGGLVFASAFGRADDGRALAGFWPAARDVGATTAAKAHAPVPPAAPAAPAAPAVKHVAGNGVSVTIHDGKVQIDGIQALVDGQLDDALSQIKDAKDLPPEARAKLEERLGTLRGTIAKRLGNLDPTDMDQFGKQMDQFGKDMDQFGKDMEKWGNDFGKQYGQKLTRQWGAGNIHIGTTDDDDNDQLSTAPNVGNDDDLDEAVADLGDLSLQPPQRAAITKLRTDSDRTVATAKKALDQASQALQKQLENPAVSDAEITKAIDLVTQQEATIRKARILAWVNARRVLDDTQRKKVESAAKPK